MIAIYDRFHPFFSGSRIIAVWNEILELTTRKMPGDDSGIFIEARNKTQFVASARLYDSAKISHSYTIVIVWKIGTFDTIENDIVHEIFLQLHFKFIDDADMEEMFAVFV